MVVIAIVAILIGLLLAAVQRVREAANRAACANNMKQIVLAAHLFHDSTNRLPNSQYGIRNGINYGAGPNSYAWSWMALLLPYVEQQPLYVQAGVPTSPLLATRSAEAVIPLYLCPSDSSPRAARLDAGNLVGLPVGPSTYKGVSGANWGEDYDDFQQRKGTIRTDWRNAGTNDSFDGLNQGDGAMYRADLDRPLRLVAVTDGASNTFLVGEDLPAKNIWVSWPYANNAYGTCAIPPNVRRPDRSEYLPRDWPNTWSFRSAHPGGLQFACADGSVHFIAEGITLSVYRAMATIRGGETVGLP